MRDPKKKEKPQETSFEPRVSERAPTGIAGLDHLLLGGLPAHHPYLGRSHPVAGKTTLGMQFLLEGIRHGHSCMCITLSETAEEAGGRVRKALSVLRKRTGKHESTIREIGVKNNALWVGEPVAAFRGVRTGVPENARPLAEDKR